MWAPRRGGGLSTFAPPAESMKGESATVTLPGTPSTASIECNRFRAATWGCRSASGIVRTRMAGTSASFRRSSQACAVRVRKVRPSSR